MGIARINPRKILQTLPALIMLLAVGLSPRYIIAATSSPATTQADGDHVSLQFDGGYETDPRDRGRPVVLVGNALGVTPEVFRDAFSGVHPAGPNSGGPTPDEARANKRVLIDKLAPYGVTNDRLDEVSNYYRYRRSAGEMWKHTAASGYAVVKDGAVTSVVLTNAGAGYSSTPIITVPTMPSVKLTATIAYTTDLKTNGSIKSITIDPVPTQPARATTP